MNFFQVGLGLSVIVFEINGKLSSADFETVIRSTNSIADYFSVNCLYFINDYKKSEYKMIQSLIRSGLENLGMMIAFGNLSAYNDFLKRSAEDQCHVPLRVMLGLRDEDFSEEFKGFNKIYLKHSEKIHSGVWVIFMSSLKDDFIASTFQNIYLPFDVELIIAWINNKEVHFKEVYQVAPSYPIRQPYFGNWSLHAGLFSPKNPSRYFRRSNLEGFPMRVGYIDGNEPFIFKDSLSGYLLDIWRVLEDAMNMSSVFTRVSFKMVRDPTQNSWFRIMSKILEKELDVGLADFISTTNRVAMFDYSYPLITTNFQLFFRIFDDEVLSHTLLLPFENEIWFAVLIWLVFNSLTIFWACNLSRRLTSSQEIHIKFPTSFFISFGVLCGQGTSKVPKSSSCRILFLCIFIVATILIPSYSASLTRYLTAKPSTISFRDFAEFRQAGSHKMLVVNAGFEYHIFNATSDKRYNEQIFERYIKNKKLPQNYREGIEMMCSKEKTAFFAITLNFVWEWNSPRNKKIREDCVLRKMSQNAGILVIGMIYPKKSRFKGLIDHHLKTLHFAGIMDRLKMKYWKKRIKSNGKLWESVGLQESKALFQIYMGGMILAFLFVFSEYVVNKSISKCERRKKKRLRRLGFA